MKLIIHFLLLSSFSMPIRAAISDKIHKAILEHIKETNGTASSGVRFHVGGYLGKGASSIVWKCDYHGRTLAFKITKDETGELKAFRLLNAVYNPKVEKLGIPNVYGYGYSIIHIPYWGIGMTLLEETLEERWNKQDKNISELSILLIFKRGVKILKYLNKKKILHNDIKPANVLFRGSEVFFGDFNVACSHGLDRVGYQSSTPAFASSGLYAKKERTPMDDLESLVFTLWSVAGIEWDKVNSSSTERKPEGKTLAECKASGTAKAKMITKCNGFRNEHVQEACQLIAADEMLKETHVPDYERIQTILEEAIERIHPSKGKSLMKIFTKDKPQFEWLTGESSQSV